MPALLDDDANSYFEVSWRTAAIAAVGTLGLSVGRFVGLTTPVFAVFGVAALLVALRLVRRSDRVAGSSIEVAVAVAVNIAFPVTTILGVYFVLAPNSFANFWFLAAVIAAASVALREPIRSPVGEGSSLSTTAL